jgi:hypothetical protein
MNTPADHNAFQHDLEIFVRMELTLAEKTRPGQEADGVLADEWMFDPDGQRYVVSLRTLLGAIEAMEDWRASSQAEKRGERRDAGDGPDGLGSGS